MTKPRPICPTCRRALATCVCELLRPFHHDTLFAIAAHPKEARNKVGTLALVRRALPEARIFVGRGAGIDSDPPLQAFLEDPGLDPWILYPAPDATPLSEVRPRPGRRLALVVVDGTWHQARALVRDSRRLRSLPRAAFIRATPSEYRIRQQPRLECLSTAEAVHEAIEVLAGAGTCAAPPGRAHDSLLLAFRELVSRQLGYEHAMRTLSNGAPL
jgi:DTW domain-containing protein YfiP